MVALESQVGLSCNLFPLPPFDLPSLLTNTLKDKSLQRYLSNWQSKKPVATTPKPFHQPPDDIGAAFYPQLGPYSSRLLTFSRKHSCHLQSSREPATLAAHMDMMVKAGAGVVALSWYPPGLSDENGITFNLISTFQLFSLQAPRVIQLFPCC